MEHGYDVYEWADGMVYKNEWKENKMHGEGTFYWPGGINYNGEWRDLKAAWIFHYGHAEF